VALLVAYKTHGFAGQFDAQSFLVHLGVVQRIDDGRCVVVGVKTRKGKALFHLDKRRNGCFGAQQFNVFACRRFRQTSDKDSAHFFSKNVGVPRLCWQ